MCKFGLRSFSGAASPSSERAARFPTRDGRRPRTRLTSKCQRNSRCQTSDNRSASRSTTPSRRRPMRRSRSTGPPRRAPPRRARPRWTCASTTDGECPLDPGRSERSLSGATRSPTTRRETATRSSKTATTTRARSTWRGRV